MDTEMGIPRSGGPMLKIGTNTRRIRNEVIYGSFNRNTERDEKLEREPGGNELGSDHSDRGQSRHLHQDRFRKPESSGVLQHVLNVPGLQRLYEEQRPARRAFHHESD